MAEHQAVLDKWFLRQDIIDQLLESGEESDEAKYFSDRIITIAETEEAEHQSLEDPFDRSVALVLSLVREEGLDAWDIDLSAFHWFVKKDWMHGILIYQHSSKCLLRG